MAIDPKNKVSSMRRISPKKTRKSLEQEKSVPVSKRSRHVRNPLVVGLHFLFSMLLLLCIGAAGGLYFASNEMSKAGPLEQERTVVIARGSGLTDIAAKLNTNGVISTPNLFRYWAQFKGEAPKLKAGEYKFEPQISMQGVIDKLVEGKAILHAITFPEGLTSYQVVERLLEDKILTGQIETLPTEGSLLPETYTFDRGTTRAQILEQMQAAQAKALDEIWETRQPDLPLEDKSQMVTLASIVEKETGQAEERPHVAGAFINRLNRGIKLQSDPTIIYGIFGGKGKPSDRPIYRSDITKPTAYNTYTIPALPPGPIANPGRAALEAVANPKETEDIYFVADGTGGHAFAKTLKEHNENVARWRKIEAEQAKALEDKTKEQGNN